tara:strand:- start:1878 stop:2294 length:417 start_codon:yes stop_codon:yes gene_type:complete
MAITWTEYTPRNNADSAVKYWVAAGDGVEATDQVLVDYSELSGTFTKLAVVRLAIHTNSGATWTFEFDANTDAPLAIFDNVGGSTGTGAVGLPDFDLRDTEGIIDPAGDGTTGDIVVTTSGFANGDFADILIEVRKIP